MIEKIVHCMTASTNPFPFGFDILSLNLPLITIYYRPCLKKYIYIPLLYYQLPFLLTLGNILFILLKLVTPSKLIYLLPNILKLSISRWKAYITVIVWKGTNMLGSMMKLYATKTSFYCYPCSIHKRIYYFHVLFIIHS